MCVLAQSPDVIDAPADEWTKGYKVTDNQCLEDLPNYPNFWIDYSQYDPKPYCLFMYSGTTCTCHVDMMDVSSSERELITGRHETTPVMKKLTNVASQLGNRPIRT